MNAVKCSENPLLSFRFESLSVLHFEAPDTLYVFNI